jgi:hypothetical protein
MRANSSSTTFPAPTGDAFDPSVFERTSANPTTSLRPVLDRSRLWNQRNQRRSYQFNLHDRIQRVLTAWQSHEPEYGSLRQMTSDLSEISSIEVPADIEPARDLPSSSSLPSMPTNIQPTTIETPQPVATDNTEADADNNLNAETQLRLNIILDQLTPRAIGGRKSALTELSLLLDIVASDTEFINPGTNSYSLLLFPLSLLLLFACKDHTGIHCSLLSRVLTLSCLYSVPTLSTQVVASIGKPGAETRVRFV